MDDAEEVSDSEDEGDHAHTAQLVSKRNVMSGDYYTAASKQRGVDALVQSDNSHTCGSGMSEHRPEYTKPVDSEKDPAARSLGRAFDAMFSPIAMQDTTSDQLLQSPLLCTAELVQLNGSGAPRPWEEHCAERLENQVG